MERGRVVELARVSNSLRESKRSHVEVARSLEAVVEGADFLLVGERFTTWMAAFQ